MVKSLHILLADNVLDTDAKKDAREYLQFWINPTNIVCVYGLHKIFSIVDGLTTFLQTQGLDMISAINSIKGCCAQLSEMKNLYQENFKDAVNFMKNVYALMKKDDECTMIEQYLSGNQLIVNIDTFKNSYLSFIDLLLLEIKERFSSQLKDDLYVEVMLFDPAGLKKLIENENISHSNPIKKLCRLNDIEDDKIAFTELKEFAEK